MSMQPNILLFDIENSPARGYFFGKVYETSVLSVSHQSYILCYSYQWWGEKTVHTVALPDFPSYSDDPNDDRLLMESLWNLLDKAHVVVAQNGDAFDIKHVNSRFAFHRMTPPSPYKTVDTLKKLRKSFNLPSNKLDYVCNYFSLGGKLPNTGKDLWLKCMQGDEKAWKEMKRYNKQDVVLLTKLYELLLPWGRGPNQNLITDNGGCYACGSLRLIKRGEDSSYGRIYQRLLCLDCGAWNRDFGERRGHPIHIRPL